jgi:hypothetical protein
MPTNNNQPTNQHFFKLAFHQHTMEAGSTALYVGAAEMTI